MARIFSLGEDVRHGATVRVKAIVAFALAAIGNVGCGATPIQVPDAGAAGSGGSNPGDGSADAASSNPGGCHAVLASDYDQSCVVDTDCVGVGEVPTCPVSACDGCLAQGINKNAVAQYLAALSQAFTSAPPGEQCACPCEGIGALCRGGKCQAASCSPPRSDTLPACANAGGTCAYRANTTCNATGPPDACAYSDEFCCLN